MMGHRSRLVGGDEYDALTRFRRFLKFGPGARKKIKRKHNKRIRAQQKNLKTILADLDEPRKT